jgi:hypothetical protein
MVFKPLDQWIAELRTHRDQLAAELKRIDAALAQLEGKPADTAGGTVSTAAPTTLDMIMTLFRANPGTGYDAEEIWQWLQDSGVSSNAADPVNSVRGALSRLKQRGLVTNVRRGVFRLNQPEDEPKVEAESDLWTAQPSTDDDSWARQASEREEPPF